MDSPLRLLLIRHGNTFEAGETSTQVGARTDLPLTQAGRGQAEALGKLLRQEELFPKALFCSSLKRQRETAEIIHRVLGSDMLLYDKEQSLCEIDYGKWENLTTAAIKERWSKEHANWTEAAIWPDEVFAGTEKEFHANIEAFLKSIRERFKPGDTVAAVSSGGVIRYFRSFIEKEWSSLVEKRNMKEIKVKTGSISELLLYPNRLEVKRWNESP